MPADVIWTDSGTEQRQPLCREGRAGRQERSRVTGQPLFPSQGLWLQQQLQALAPHITPLFSNSHSPQAQESLLPACEEPCQSTGMFSHSVVRRGAQHNSSLSPQQQPCFVHQVHTALPKTSTPPMPSPSALSLLLDHQGFVHWDTAETRMSLPLPLLLFWAADKRPQCQGLPTCQDRTWHCGCEN